MKLLEQQDIKCGKDIIDFCLDKDIIAVRQSHNNVMVGIGPTTLAALLSITHKTLMSWQTELIDFNSPQGKIDRLKRFYQLFYLARKNGLEAGLTLNMLGEPIPGYDDGRTISEYFMIDYSTSDEEFFSTAEKVIKSFKEG